MNNEKTGFILGDEPKFGHETDFLLKKEDNLINPEKTNFSLESIKQYIHDYQINVSEKWTGKNVDNQMLSGMLGTIAGAIIFIFGKEFGQPSIATAGLIFSAMGMGAVTHLAVDTAITQINKLNKNKI